MDVHFRKKKIDTEKNWSTLYNLKEVHIRKKLTWVSVRCKRWGRVILDTQYLLILMLFLFSVSLCRKGVHKKDWETDLGVPWPKREQKIQACRISAIPCPGGTPGLFRFLFRDLRDWPNKFAAFSACACVCVQSKTKTHVPIRRFAKTRCWAYENSKTGFTHHFNILHLVLSSLAVKS